MSGTKKRDLLPVSAIWLILVFGLAVFVWICNANADLLVNTVGMAHPASSQDETYVAQRAAYRNLNEKYYRQESQISGETLRSIPPYRIIAQTKDSQTTSSFPLAIISAHARFLGAQPLEAEADLRDLLHSHGIPQVDDPR